MRLHKSRVGLSLKKLMEEEECMMSFVLLLL